MKWSALLAMAFVLFILFYPETFPLKPLRDRQDTQYWNLATGSKIAYTYIPGKGSRKPYPLIYLHGGPAAGVTNLEINTLSALAGEGYDIYFYDQEGCGRSGRLENIKEYTADRQKRDLEEIVIKTGAPKVILIAQSWGSTLATLFLADNPGKVDKIAITAPGPIQPQNPAAAGITAPDSLHLITPYLLDKEGETRGRSLRVRTMIYLARKFGIKFESDAEADGFAAMYTSELNKTQVCDRSHAVKSEGTEGFYANYMTRLNLGKVRDPREKLRHCDVPILVMKAQCDNQPWGYTAEYLDLFPVHQFVLVPGAGHNIFIEQPGIYLATLKTFLQ